ncbi:MAG: 1,2-phenylacetyl-CoA epoxidase subunit PaaD [Flavobacteriales bacterium]
MNKEQIYSILETVKDPEIPALNVVEMGIVREVNVQNSTIIITPTYSGCPAMKTIEEDILSALQKNGFTSFQIQTSLSPAWTTDWMTDAARIKLEKEGIAPPQKGSADKNLLMGRIRDVKCPRCGSHDTTMISQFGSTACKSLYKCEDCKEPFDYFKCI